MYAIETKYVHHVLQLEAAWLFRKGGASALFKYVEVSKASSRAARPRLRVENCPNEGFLEAV